MKRKSQLFIILSFIVSSSTHFLFPSTGTIDKNFIEKFLPKNPIIVEGGAHKGIDTAQMAELWPDAQIYAFEPHPLFFKKLCSRMHSYKNVICSSLALSNKTSWQEFSLSSFGFTGASTILKPSLLFFKTYPGIIFHKKIGVHSVNLDDWAQKNGIDHIDFLWLDLQGAEPLVLMHCPKILKTIEVIYTEVNYIPLYVNGILYEQLKAFLQEQGFREIYEIHPHGAKGNVLFVKSNKEKITQYEARRTRRLFIDDEEEN